MRFMRVTVEVFERPTSEHSGLPQGSDGEVVFREVREAPRMNCDRGAQAENLAGMAAVRQDEGIALVP